MGLQLSKDTNFGVSAKQAYAKIDNFSGTGNTVTVNVNYYWDKGARDKGCSYIDRQSFDMPYNLDSDQNVIKQAYEELKKTDSFKGAVDVLETK